MKKSLFLYLFILALLMLVFTYMYYSKNLAFEQERYEKLNKRMTDSIQSVNAKLLDANYFTLENNDNAKNYFENLDTAKLIPQINNQIMALNDSPDGNSLVPYDKINQQRFIVNKIKVLNHRWIIADFSDGIIWGELLLKYFVEDDGSITFERMDAQLYPKN